MRCPVKHMKLSVSSYSFQQYITAGKLTQFSAIAAAHDLGFDAIEFVTLNAPEGVTRRDFAKSLADEAARLGMTINAYAVGANLFTPDEASKQAALAQLFEEVDIAEILGAKVMRHDVCWAYAPDKGGRSFDAMLPVIAENARAVTEYAAAKGIRTCSENHGYIAQDSDRVERLVNAVAHPNYGVLIDVGNFACADEDSVTATSRLAPLAVHAHAKDFIKRSFLEGPAEGFFQTRGCNYLRGTAVGDGVIPVKQCIAVLKRAGYDGYLSLEYEGKEDCIEGIKKGRENLLSYLADL